MTCTFNIKGLSGGWGGAEFIKVIAEQNDLQLRGKQMRMENAMESSNLMAHTSPWSSTTVKLPCGSGALGL